MTIATAHATFSDLELGKDIVYLSKHDVLNLGIDRTEILDITKNALIEHGNHRYEMPAKIGVHPYPEVFYHAVPAFVPGMNAVGCKWIECYPNNPKKFGLPQTTGLMIINDVESGVPLAIMDSTWVTAMRTPAVTILSAAALHPGADTFGMFGCGVQGKEHIKYAAGALPELKKVYVYDHREAAADALIDELQSEVPFTLIKGKGPEIARCGDKYMVDSIEEHEIVEQMGYFSAGLASVAAETGILLTL